MNEQSNNPELSSQGKTPVKKSNNKTIVVAIAVILIAAGIYAGLALTKKDEQVQGQENRRQAASENSDTNRARQRRTNGFQFQGVTTTAEDMIVGGQIVVVGTVNSDGSITAETIRLGDFSDEDFSGFRNFSGDHSTIENTGTRGSQSGDHAPGSFDPGEFQNLTPEERQQRFQELRESGQVPEGFGGGRGQGGGFSGRAEGTEIIRGEIIDRDDISITVKLVDGGSRLVFYSEEVRIIRVGEVNGDE